MNDIVEELEKESQTEEEPGLDKIEIEHIELLQQLALTCSSNKHQFTNRDRLNKIMEILSDSPYYPECLSLADMYKHKDLDTKDIILVTAHCDTIPNKPFVEYAKSTGLLKGTFDNLICNAVIVILMKKENIPDNIVFAFTGDEETEKCRGCKEVVNTLMDQDYHIEQAVALDVTYEGYNRANFSFENFYRKKDGHKETKLYKAFQSIIDGCADSVNTPKGMYDEGYALKECGIYESGSICIPVQGPMHKNSGCFCRQKTFEGYILALTSLLYSLTNTKQNLIEEYKMMRAKLKPELPVYQFTDYEYEENENWLEMIEAAKEYRESIGLPWDDGIYEEYDEEEPAIIMDDWEASDYIFNCLEMCAEDEKDLFIDDILHTRELSLFFSNQGLTSREEIIDTLSQFFDDNYIFDYERE